MAKKKKIGRPKGEPTKIFGVRHFKRTIDKAIKNGASKPIGDKVKEMLNSYANK